MKTFIYPIAFCLLLSSCSNVYYAPNVQNVPLIKNINDIKINAGLGITEGSTEIAVQSSFALDSVWAAQINFSNSITKSGTEIHQLDVAIGRYKGRTNNWITEVYAGIGFAGYNWNTQSPSVKFNAVKTYLQGNLGYSIKNLEIVFSIRTGTNTMFNGISSLNKYYIDVQHFTPIGNSYTFFVAEPAVTLRAGSSNFKIQVQLGFSSGTGFNDYNLYQDNFNFNTGFVFLFNKKKS